MQLTYGIITAGHNDKFITQIVQRIYSFKIPEYEIIIVGNTQISGPNINVIPFDESQKSGWITKKKNIITEKAKYENIVYSHDYIIPEPDWYDGFLKFGNDFNVCMNIILNIDNTRFRDWTLWPHNDNIVDEIVYPHNLLLPYNIDDLSKYMYISGSYWIAKKKTMQEFPLDEKLAYAESEDVDWSKRVREKYSFSMNPYSTSKLLKHKDVYFKMATEEIIKKIRNFNSNPQLTKNEFINYKYGEGEMLPYERYTLYNWIKKHKVTRVLETGTRFGTSTYYIANALLEQNGQVVTCDPWYPAPVQVLNDFSNIKFSSVTSDVLIREIIKQNVTIDFIFFDGPDIPEIAINDIKKLEHHITKGCLFSMHDWETTKRNYDVAVCNKAELIRPYIEKSNRWEVVEVLSGLEVNSDYYVLEDSKCDSVGLCLYRFLG